jgi:hypothetical protein
MKMHKENPGEMTYPCIVRIEYDQSNFNSAEIERVRTDLTGTCHLVLREQRTPHCDGPSGFEIVINIALGLASACIYDALRPIGMNIKKIWDWKYVDIPETGSFKIRIESNDVDIVIAAGSVFGNEWKYPLRKEVFEHLAELIADMHFHLSTDPLRILSIQELTTIAPHVVIERSGRPRFIYSKPWVVRNANVCDQFSYDPATRDIDPDPVCMGYDVNGSDVIPD